MSGGEGADEVFDELLKKHGKVVYRSGGDQKSPADEADDDAESLSCELSLSPSLKDVTFLLLL